MIARLYENPVGFRKIGYGNIRKGLDGTIQSFLRTFTTWFLQNWDQNNMNWFNYTIGPIINKRYEQRT